jgi:hypothetical protein
MKANEARIGNWIIDPHRDGIGNEGYDKVGKWDFANHLEDYEPIPLTEEILLKCGFEFYSEELGAKVFSIMIPKSTSRILISDKGHFTLESEGTFWYMRSYKCPEYLHQLQNLYFALTNEELNIDLW